MYFLTDLLQNNKGVDLLLVDSGDLHDGKLTIELGPM